MEMKVASTAITILRWWGDIFAQVNYLVEEILLFNKKANLETFEFRKKLNFNKYLIVAENEQ